MTIEVRSNEPTPVTAPKAEKSEPANELDTAKPAPEESSEQNLSEASGATETEEVEANDADHADESEAEKPSDQESDKPKKKGGFQKRIDKLNARISAIQQEADIWKQQALKTQAAPDATQSKVDLAPKTNDGKPDPSRFDSHAEYVEALTDWKTEQKFKEREAKQEQSKLQAAHSEKLKSHQERVKAFSEKTKDFQEAISEVDDVRLSPVVSDILITSENGPELMYELAKNRDEYERINKMTPIMAARELGKIEARISSKSSAQKVESKKITNAPKPLDPVGASGKGSNHKSIFDSSLSQAEYEEIRREQMKRRRA